MKKYVILAVSALLFASCSNERAKTMGEYEEYIKFQEDLTEKVLDGVLTEATYDIEYDKADYAKIVKNGEDAKHDLMEVKDLLDEKEKSALADLMLREKRNHHVLIDAFIDAKKAAKEEKENSKKK